ncbi:PAC2 family protein [Candidatus Woesearchaeota archaeon]|nr:PAC2 family protein [Candidatus Woesearchaeota archaeon]
MIELKKKPTSPIIIEGFPGFGLVGTIATEFLIDHLKTKLIGKIFLDEMPAMVAIHEGEVVEPIGIYYNEKYNMILVHGINSVVGSEWKITEDIAKMAKELKAKEIISLEGVAGSMEGEALPEETKAFCFSSKDVNKEKLKKADCAELKEGIIMGVTGAILLKVEKIPTTCIFAETPSNLPDSKAAAKVIEVLDKYLGLKVDYEPLLKQAEKFEQKLKGLLEHATKTKKASEEKQLSYVG